MNQPATAQAIANVAVNAANFELNKGDDFIIALDISGSMQTTDCPADLSRLDYSMEQFSTFVKEASKWDTDGVSLYAFGVKVHNYPDVATEQLNEIIGQIKAMKLESATMTHLVVQAAFAEHKARRNEQTVLFIFTDGEPTNEDALLQTIADITQQVKDEREFNIGFVTVGKRSAGLEAFLTKLDDNIPGAKYDIVDVKRLEDVDFYAAFDGALND